MQAVPVREKEGDFDQAKLSTLDDDGGEEVVVKFPSTEDGPESVEAGIQAARTFWGGGDRSMTIRTLQATCRAFSEDGRAWEHLGAYLNLCGLTKAAGQAFLRCLHLEKPATRPGPLAGLAACLMVDGDFGQAEKLLEEALRVVGYTRERSDILSNLAICQVQRGDLDAAEHSVIGALLLTPRHRDALYNRAVIYEKQGRREDALNTLRDVVVLDPKMRTAQKSLGVLSDAFFQWEESEVAWKEALMMTPESHPEFEMVAQRLLDVLLRQSKGGTHKPLMALLMERNPSPENRMLRTRLHIEEWEWKEAVAQSEYIPMDNEERKLTFAYLAAMSRNDRLLEELLSEVPDCAKKLNCRWTAIIDEQKYRELTRDSLQYLKNPNPKDVPDEMAQLHFYVGDFAHRQQDYELAIRHYCAGHDQKAIFEPMTPETFANHCALIEGQKDHAVEPAEKRDDDPSLVFIVGMPRSGTTLAEQILDTHDEVYGIGESFFSNFAAQIFLRDHDAEMLRRRGRNYRDHVRTLDQGKSVVIDKMPHNFQYLSIIARLYPEAKFIWARRDPIDTCMSIFSKNFAGRHPYAHKLDILGAHYRWHETLMRQWMDLHPGRIRILQYEDLVDDLEGQIAPLLEWMGLSWDPRCAAFHTNQRQVRTSSLNQVNKPLYKNGKGAWQVYNPWLGPLNAGLAGI